MSLIYIESQIPFDRILDPHASGLERKPHQAEIFVPNRVSTKYLKRIIVLRSNKDNVQALLKDQSVDKKFEIIEIREIIPKYKALVFYSLN